MTWQVVELADGKPPYQWKHGWVPLTPDAEAIKTKRKSGSAKDAPETRKYSPPRKSYPTPAQAHMFRNREKYAGSAGPVEHEEGPQRATHLEFQALARKQLANDPLSDEETEAVQDYVFNSSPVSNHLRGVSVPGHEARKEKTLRTIRHLSEAIERSRIEKELTLYRGLNWDHQERLQVGDVFSDPAPSSTSYDPSVAQGFAEGFGRDPVLLVIRAPKGSRVLLTDHESQNLEYAQYEGIVGPKQRMRVTHIEDGGKLVHVELED